MCGCGYLLFFAFFFFFPFHFTSLTHFCILGEEKREKGREGNGERGKKKKKKTDVTWPARRQQTGIMYHTRAGR